MMPILAMTPAVRNAVYEAQKPPTGELLPWELTVAQWALESGWGKHEPGNNCFGIKDFPGSYGKQSIWTKEFLDGRMQAVHQTFAVFQTLADCFAKHAELLTQGAPYKAAYEAWRADPNRTPRSLAKLICPIYATDPNYLDYILTIMDDFERTDF